MNRMDFWTSAETQSAPPASFAAADPLLLLLGGFLIGFLAGRKEIAQHAEG